MWLGHKKNSCFNTYFVSLPQGLSPNIIFGYISHISVNFSKNFIADAIQHGLKNYLEKFP